ncbi:MAG: cellobiose phosphorylase [Roseburia sp.]|nr:cellobiose phosphorylase [Roseburia sp.]MCM1096496.1 cellobiose phosphorylase [Ruminococcus flavefaciens]
MTEITYLNAEGDFRLENAQLYPEIYFPLANEGHMISSITPHLAGDCKTGQNAFLLAPASAETLHESRASRNFWIQLSGGKPWSVTGQSAAQRGMLFEGGEETVLTGGLLWQKISRRKADQSLLAEVLSFVPAGCDRAEIMQVVITNLSDEALTITPTAAIPLYCRSADNIRDHRHVTSLLLRGKVSAYGLDVTPTLTFDERGHLPNELTFRVWGADEDGAPPQGCMPLVSDFTGAGSYDWPEALVNPKGREWLTPGCTVQGGEMIAALRFGTVRLEPGRKKSYQIVLAVQDDPAAYLTPAGVEEALERTKAYWQEKAGLRVLTGNPKWDCWLRWVSAQPTLRRICGCSFLPHHDYGRGGRGWRDLWQDSLALLLREPDKVREDLLRYFAGVRLDGTNATIIGERPGEFRADRNNIPRVWMDHGFWPMLTVQLYLDETGDDSFLLEQQSYFSDTMAFRGEGGPRETAGAERRGTVLEHLLIQGITAFFDVGEHGHIRLRGADWNDGLDMAGERGESVAFTAAYSYHLKLLSRQIQKIRSSGETVIRLPGPLIRLLDTPCGSPEEMRRGLTEYCRSVYRGADDDSMPLSALAEKLDAMSDWIRSHIRRTEWVGDGKGQHWFNGYYDNHGRQVEGLFEGEARMMLTGQAFCLLSGTADERQAEQIVRAVNRYLYRPDRGGVCLNTDFHEVRLDLGRMFGFAYGSKENGAVFCHMAVMYAYALYARSFPEEGWRVLEQLFAQAGDFPKSRVLPGVPEYFDERGRGMYPYLTGAASWMWLTVQTQMFGVRGEEGNLVLESKLLAEQFNGEGWAEISCHSAGCQLRVRYENPLRLEPSAYKIGKVTCGGREIPGSGKKVVLPRGELGGGEVEITAELIPAG